MRILCLTPWYPPYPGAQSGNFIRDSAAALAAEGHALQVLVAEAWHPWRSGFVAAAEAGRAGKAKASTAGFTVDGLRYLSIPGNRLRSLSWRLFLHRVGARLRKEIAAFKPDVIIAHTEQAGGAAVAVAESTAVPVVVVLHGINTHPGLNTAAEHARLRHTLRAAERVVLVGASLAPHFAGISGADGNFRVVPNGFAPPPAVVPRPAGAWPQPLRFISVSNLHEGKGVDLNLQALARLAALGFRDWTYTIVGDGAQRKELEQLVRQLGLGKAVRFTGAVDNALVYGLLAEADVFVLPSWREAFGIAWLEAMSAGLLAVAVAGQGPATFITDGVTGILVPPQDAAALALRLQDIIANPGPMQQIAARGQALANRDYTWERHAEQLAAVCREAIEVRR